MFLMLVNFIFDLGIWCLKWNIWKLNLDRMGLKIEVLSMLFELLFILKEIDRNNLCKKI